MNRPHVSQQVLQHTAAAWNDGLGAAADHDVLAARRVMRGAAARRTLLRAAPGEVLPDLVKINRLLGQLAQSILASPGIVSLGEPERAAVELSRRIGFDRLAYFSASMPRPVIDRRYIHDGHELLDVVATLSHSAPRSGSTCDICLALNVALLRTSRQATRIV